MEQGINKDQKGWSIQAFNPQSAGVTNGVNVTIGGTDYPLASFTAFRCTTDTSWTLSGQTITQGAGVVTACRGNDNISFTGSDVIEVM